MRKSAAENIEGLTRKTSDHAYDGRITEVTGDYVHVRLAGGERKILHNVIIADHIDKEVLRPKLFCKVAKLYEREFRGRYILTDILPQIHYGDYAGAAAIPMAPYPSAVADCEAGQWTITWTEVEATYYQLWWSTDAQGTGATLLTETVSRRYDVAFDETDPPKMFFAVKAIHGAQESNLSAWVTDQDFTTGAPLVAFGDSWLHGDAPKTDAWRKKVKQSLVKESTNYGGNYADDLPATNPPNIWSDSAPVPTFVDLEYMQVQGDYLLARWQNAGGIWRGWIYDGADWLTPYDQSSLPTELKPIWMDQDGTYLLVTCYEDGAIKLHAYYLTDLSHFGTWSLGAATLAQVDSKQKYAFPVATDVAGEWYVAGNMETIPS